MGIGDIGVYTYMGMIKDIEVIQTALAWSDLLSAPLDEGIEACRRLEDAMSSRQVKQQQAEAEAKQRAEAKCQVEIKNTPHWTWIRIAEQWFAICRDRYVKPEDIPDEISIHRLDGTESQHKVLGHVLRGWNATLRVSSQVTQPFSLPIQIDWCEVPGCYCAVYRGLHLRVSHTPNRALGERYIAYIDGNIYGSIYKTPKEAQAVIAARVAEISAREAWPISSVE